MHRRTRSRDARPRHPGGPRGEATVDVDDRRLGRSTVPAGTSVMRAATAGRRRPSPSCAPPTRSRRSARAGSASSRSTGVKGTPGVVHHAVRRRHGRVDTADRAGAAAAPRRDGALPLRPPERLRRLRGGRLRDADTGRTTSGCAEVRYGLGGATPPGRARRRRVEPLLRLRPGRVHRLLALRAGLRRDPGHVRADRSRAAASTRGSPPAAPTSSSSECVSCGACVQACPTDALQEKSVVELGMPTRSVGHHLRLLRRRLLVQGRGAGRATHPGRADGAVRRTAAPTRATRASRAASPTATPRTATGSSRRWCATRSTTSGATSRGTRRSRGSPPGSSGCAGRVRRRRDRRHHVVAVHQRGGLRRPEDGAGGVRQQQRRHLRAGLPLPHRLRPQADVRHLGRHPGLRVGRAGRRHARDRRQPDRRPPGVRVADEAAAARGRAADRRRPAPDRPGAHAARRGGLPPAGCSRAPTSRSSTRWPTSSSPRGSSTEEFVREPLRGRRRRTCEFIARPEQLARGD